MSDVALNDEPTNGELLTAVQTLRRGGSITTAFVGAGSGSRWAVACVRYVKGLGPDTSDENGLMRYERVHDVAELSKMRTLLEAHRREFLDEYVTRVEDDNANAQQCLRDFEQEALQDA